MPFGSVFGVLAGEIEARNTCFFLVWVKNLKDIFQDNQTSLESELIFVWVRSSF